MFTEEEFNTMSRDGNFKKEKRMLRKDCPNCKAEDLMPVEDTDLKEYVCINCENLYTEEELNVRIKFWAKVELISPFYTYVEIKDPIKAPHHFKVAIFDEMIARFFGDSFPIPPPEETDHTFIQVLYDGSVWDPIKGNYLPIYRLPAEKRDKLIEFLKGL